MSMQNISYFVLTCLTVLIGISLATSPTQSSLSTDLTTSGPRENCIKVSSCKCSYADGTVIDLTPLSKTDGTA